MDHFSIESFTPQLFLASGALVQCGVVLRTPFVFAYFTQPGSMSRFVIPISFAHGVLVPPRLATLTLNLALTVHTNAFGFFITRTLVHTIF